MVHVKWCRQIVVTHIAVFRQTTSLATTSHSAHPDAAKRHVAGAVAGVVAGDGTWDDLPHFAHPRLEVPVVEVAKWRCGVLLTTMHDPGLSSYGFQSLLRMSRQPMQTRAATANTPPQHTPPPLHTAMPSASPPARTEGRRRRRCLAMSPPPQEALAEAHPGLRLLLPQLLCLEARKRRGGGG
jgi:hypothetical protein